MEDFALDLVEGQLLIRNTPEPLALSTDSTISGSHDTGEGGTGAVTNGTFSTPTISFQTVDPGTGFDVFVDASFVSAAPATGSIDSEGNVQFNAALTVNLHVEVSNPPILVEECTAGPVNLTLDSTAPWDPATKQVTVADANFIVPEVPVMPDCIDLVANGINSRLAGAGHSLEMTLEGDLNLPPPPGCPTLTDVEVAPASPSRLGDEVTFTATVTPKDLADPACDDVAPGVEPAGLVEFRAGSTLLGAAPLDGTGVATFATTGIAAGTFALTARYRGEPPFGGSTSDPTTYKVAAPVAITADIPDTIQIAAAPAEFDVTLTNTGLGGDVTNGRLQATVTSPIAGLPSGFVVLEWWNGTAWVPTTSSSASIFFSAISPDTGFALPAGTEVTRKVRFGFVSTLGPRPIEVALELVEVDPVTGLPAVTRAPFGDEPPTPNLRGRTLARTLAVNGTRLSTTLTGSPLQPATVRQGQTVQALFANSNAEFQPSGTYSVLLDGRPVLVRENETPPEIGLQPTVSALKGAFNVPISNVEFAIPDDGATGTRTVTVRYSGNEFFEPAQYSETINVLASRGSTYACSAKFVATDLFYVNLTAHANFGKVRPSGATVNLSQLDITMYADRGNAPFSALFYADVNPVVPVGGGNPFGVNVNGVDFGLGGLSTGTATDFTVANNFPMFDPADPNPDMVLGFQGESGSGVVEGEPGDVIPITLDSVKVTSALVTPADPFPLDIECVPVGDPVTLGEVTIAGTTLTVDAPEPTRLGDSVTLKAQVAPPGMPGNVEFRDGDDTLTVVPVRSDGTAIFTTDGLEPGAHNLSARFYGGLAANSTTSTSVALHVLPEFDCAAFAEEGDGAVVRLVYIELLGRCPDQAGYDHWVGRLEGGTSAEVFARTISRTSEAVGRVVDDAYETMLGRAPDAVGRAFWVGRLQGHGRYDQLLADLAGSGEFWSLSGSSDDGFVTRVYERLLNRTPEPAGLDHWVGRLDSGTSPKVLVRSLANLDEPLSRLVDASYEEILGRAPASGERSDGIELLRETGSRSGLYAELIGRPEFATRAQRFPNPED